MGSSELAPGENDRQVTGLLVIEGAGFRVSNVARIPHRSTDKNDSGTEPRLVSGAAIRSHG
jgi:hypothetical protein